MKKIFLLLFLNLLLSIDSQASVSDLVFRPGFMWSHTDSKTPTKVTTTDTDIDLGFGYVTSDKIFVGLLYVISTNTVKTSFSTTKTKVNSWGPSLGYIWEDAYLVGSYFITAEKTVDTTIKLGTDHYQIDLGYMFKFKSFFIAPQFSYINLNYTKQKTSGGTETTLDPAEASTSIVPRITFWFDL